MIEAQPPDWAALYQKHCDAMHRVAARTLRSAGRAAESEDVVMAAMESLMKSPPQDVDNWEAMMVRATQLRALDLLKSAEVRHASGTPLVGHDRAEPTSVEYDAIEAVDRQRAARVAWEKLDVLAERHRTAVVEYIAKERPRRDVADELGVSPSRVSQLVAEALAQLHEAMDKEGVAS